MKSERRDPEKNKQRDLTRMVLPSRAAKFAKDKSRELHRRERHTINSALIQHPPEEEWEDGPYFRNVNSIEGHFRSEMPYRVRERRSADNLGGLKRWVEHHQRQAGDDRRAYEKCEEIIQPGKNLICKHAMEHAAFWLDVPDGRSYYLPEETERDVAARQTQQRRSLSKNYGPVIISEEELKILLEKLYASAHGKLNKILKKHSLAKRSCREGDPCTSVQHIKTKKYFLYAPSYYNKWREISLSEYYDAIKLDQRVQIRDVVVTRTNHNIQKCENRLLIRKPSDLESLFHLLRLETCRRSHDALGGYPYDNYMRDNYRVFDDIIKLAEQLGFWN